MIHKFTTTILGEICGLTGYIMQIQNYDDKKILIFRTSFKMQICFPKLSVAGTHQQIFSKKCKFVSSIQSN